MLGLQFFHKLEVVAKFAKTNKVSGEDAKDADIMVHCFRDGKRGVFSKRTGPQLLVMACR